MSLKLQNKEFLDIKTTIECRFTCKRVRDMTTTYDQIPVRSNAVKSFGQFCKMSRIFRVYLGQFTAQVQKIRTHSEKIYYVFSKKVFHMFWEMELLPLRLKKILIFSQKKSFSYISRNITFVAPKIEKKKHFENIFYILGNRTF